MTVEEFNGLELSCGDTVEIIMNNGTRRNEILHSRNAYQGRGEDRNYITSELVSASAPLLLFVGVPRGIKDGIPLYSIIGQLIS